MYRLSCPVCSGVSNRHATVDGFDYFECSGCGIIHIDPKVLTDIDQGREIRSYNNNYWQTEIIAARERCRADGIARLTEAIFLCQRPVEEVIDIGTGAGYLLDEMAKLLPNNANRIWGVELFPPPLEQCTRSPQFVQGTIATLSDKSFDAGLCMEVVEHLTPNMLRAMLREIAERSNEGACYVFNTGLARFVKNENAAYLDPVIRGHIVSWTVEAFNILGNKYGLQAVALPGRDWAFLVEKTKLELPRIDYRMYHPLAENLTFLGDGMPGPSLLSTLAQEGIMCFFYYQQFHERTEWALRLQAELKRKRWRPLGPLSRR
jgi:2-polyprenyl-3-methyl-5-hydroxy-6-metoxy-1,4-benzoquinol methylase